MSLIIDTMTFIRDTPVMQILKNRIRRLRFDRGELTQQALADAMEVARQTINSIESGKFNPSTHLALRIAAFFGVPFEQVFYLEEES